jgi:hypothetical protein
VLRPGHYTFDCAAALTRGSHTGWPHFVIAPFRGDARAEWRGAVVTRTRDRAATQKWIPKSLQIFASGPLGPMKLGKRSKFCLRPFGPNCNPKKLQTFASGPLGSMKLGNHAKFCCKKPQKIWLPPRCTQRGGGIPIDHTKTWPRQDATETLGVPPLIQPKTSVHAHAAGKSAHSPQNDPHAVQNRHLHSPMESKL